MRFLMESRNVRRGAQSSYLFLCCLVLIRSPNVYIRDFKKKKKQLFRYMGNLSGDIGSQ